MFILFTIIFSFLLNDPPPVPMEPLQVPPIVAQVAERIDLRRGPWIAFRANVTLHFMTEENNSASCRGELFYQRLDEKILLSCFNVKNELLFTFTTNDRLFELYLPSQKAAFQGTIFDLKDSPDIESHLNPLDLYRALKPLPVPLKQSQVESWDLEKINLKVFGKKYQKSYLSRRVTVSRGGDVWNETFYSFEEQPTVEITRSDFQEKHETEIGEKEAIIYPHQMTIESKIRPRKTVLIFEDLVFLSSIDNAVWFDTIPSDTTIHAIENPNKARR